ncbi:hypothetical protein AVEN_125255-1 [Araneus ventricosus]|uniref:Uncharacterized protein n=1 Tax=Araneus ventricosus TaxID=182803 RepID=A0A4Y2NUS6_ARAVE|nr:hypothetical protein AVEN_125255-1 [Araneus ventricosus]
MDKWLKTGTLKRSAPRTEIRTTDLAAMGITVDQQDDNHEVQRTTYWPIQPNLNSCLISTNKANEAAIEASYRIRYHIAKSGKNHTIAANLVFPCIKDAVGCMFSEDHGQKFKNIPLPKSTVFRRIKDMSIDPEATINQK